MLTSTLYAFCMLMELYMSGRRLFGQYAALYAVFVRWYVIRAV
jgi:hypothetical protein